MQKQTVQYQCPYCQEKLDLEVTLSLEANEDEHEKERLISGDLFHQNCPHCHSDFLLQVPFTYMDKRRKFVLVLVQGELLPKEMAETGSALDRLGYTLRHVQTIAQLVEKIQIFEDGMDDRKVELAKYDNFIEFVDNKKGKPENITSIEYQRVDNEVLKINIRTDDTGLAFLTPLSLLDEEFKMDQDRLSVRNADFPIIDQEWIVKSYQDISETV